MARVVALGEMLVDFVATRSGVSLPEAPAFEPAPGGAPANVAVGIARLGGACSFLGKVGDDAWGHLLVDTLATNGVDTSGITFTSQARTALAFVSLQTNGERDFLFYRHPSADMLYAPAEIIEPLITESAVLHCGSISLIAEPSSLATRHAVTIALRHGMLVSYDPNLRLPLWPDETTARETILSLWPSASVIKVSEDELRFLSQEHDMRRAAEALWHERLRLLAVTCGGEGCHYFTPAESGLHEGHVAGFAVQAVDTTGAGDSWTAALLTHLAADPQVFLDTPALEAVLRFANAAGALATTRRGAIPALPTLAQVQELMGEA